MAVPRTLRGAFGSDVEVEALSDEQSALLEKYVDAFRKYDVDNLVALLRDEATLSMPPYTLWLQGPDAIRTWLLGRGSGCRGSRWNAFLDTDNLFPLFGLPAELRDADDFRGRAASISQTDRQEVGLR